MIFLTMQLMLLASSLGSHFRKVSPLSSPLPWSKQKWCLRTALTLAPIRYLCCCCCCCCCYSQFHVWKRNGLWSAIWYKMTLATSMFFQSMFTIGIRKSSRENPRVNLRYSYGERGESNNDFRTHCVIMNMTPFCSMLFASYPDWLQEFIQQKTEKLMDKQKNSLTQEIQTILIWRIP